MAAQPGQQRRARPGAAQHHAEGEGREIPVPDYVEEMVAGPAGRAAVLWPSPRYPPPTRTKSLTSLGVKRAAGRPMEVIQAGQSADTGHRGHDGSM